MTSEPTRTAGEDELEIQTLCAVAEAVAKGRSLDEVCQTAISVVTNLMSMGTDPGAAKAHRRPH